MGKKKVVEKQNQNNVTSKQAKKKLSKVQKANNDQPGVTKQMKKKGSKQVESLNKEWIAENLTDPSSSQKFIKLNKKQKVHNNESNPKNLKKVKKSGRTPPNEITQNVHITNPTILIKRQKLDRDPDNSNQMKKIKKTKTNESIDTESTSNETKKKKKRVKQKKKRTGVEAASATKIAPNAGKYLLINLITMTLNQNEKSMPVTKLQKKVLKKYCQIKGAEEGPKLIKEFHQSLKLTKGVEVLDDKAKLINQ
ncbi:hypothetical protein RI129_008921 [Pyrocoelia pectoralis]|uniref:Cell growth-regulating nucleolar protein-like winged helix domain-containing protein n=1 Tax=Pyrocoelia pectoralis TaxID=417401 RepID=A0AAN7VG37_9COLE